ncbi:MAG: phage terminase large subunit family protein [Phycisphaerae bacterium]|jgi:hypothetical protein
MSQNYDRKRERARERSVRQSRSGRDIGDIPVVQDSARKQEALRSFREFCQAYFPHRFHLAFSADHQRVIAKLETAVTSGGQFAVAMPRGFGKTALSVVGGLWSALLGLHAYVLLLGAAKAHALDMLDQIKIELSTNDRLAADFPEVCFPIRRLEHQTRRCVGQLHHGRPTLIEWRESRIRLPTIPGSRASGVIIRVAGLLGAIRGASHARADGHVVRPSLVVIDDPQTQQSARSPSQCEKREAVITRDVLGLAGPGRAISAIMPCTVIGPDDLADRILNRDRNPQWHGERCKMVLSWPTDTERWKEYAERRRAAQREDLAPTDANEFYAANRSAMDAGAAVSWPERRSADELSAIQHAMNLKIDHGDAYVAAECQNEPLREADQAEDMLTADEIVARLSGHERGLIPLGASIMTMFVDVQQRCLFWAVVAWADNFSGWLVDCGSEPDQKLKYFTLSEVRRTLQAAAPRAGLDGAIYAGLGRLAERTLGREWKRDDGAAVRIDRCLVDANWGQSTDVVYQFCRESAHAAMLTPSHGRYVGAASVPMSLYQKRPGERVGLNWRIPVSGGKRAVRHVVFDTNFWKSFLFARLGVAMGDPGALTLWGRSADAHRMLADHLTAEYPVRTEARGRTVDEWKARPGRDNHWLDCLTGCAVAASMQGAALPEMREGPGKPRRRFAQKYAAWRKAR